MSLVGRIISQIIGVVLGLSLVLQIVGLVYVFFHYRRYCSYLFKCADKLPEKIRKDYIVPKAFLLISPFTILTYPYHLPALYGIEENDYFLQFQNVHMDLEKIKAQKLKYKYGVKKLIQVTGLQISLLILGLGYLFTFCRNKC